MSGLEILAIAASVLQIADLGGKLSVKLFTFTRKIKNADKKIDSISHDIAATGAVLQQLGNELIKDEHLRLCSPDAIKEAKSLVEACRTVFDEINCVIDGKGKGKGAGKWLSIKRGINYAFVEDQIHLLKARLESLKSSLLVMLNVLIFAGQLKGNEALPILQDQRELLKQLVEEKRSNQKQFDALLKRLDNLTVDTAGDSSSIMESSTTSGQTNSSITLVSTNAGIPPASQQSEVDIARPHLPIHLHHRAEEIFDHCRLIRTLISEVNHVQYKVDLGIKYRAQQKILESHHQEWGKHWGRPTAHDPPDMRFQCFQHIPSLQEYWVEQDIWRSPHPERPTSRVRGSSTHYGAFTDDSDAEAAAGLTAMQAVDDQEQAGDAAMENDFATWVASHHRDFSTNSGAADSHDSSSDSDLVDFDISAVGGGYAADMHYGGDISLSEASSPPPTSNRPSTVLIGHGGMSGRRHSTDGAKHDVELSQDVGQRGGQGAATSQEPASDSDKFKTADAGQIDRIIKALDNIERLLPKRNELESLPTIKPLVRRQALVVGCAIEYINICKATIVGGLGLDAARIAYFDAMSARNGSNDARLASHAGLMTRLTALRSLIPNDMWHAQGDTADPADTKTTSQSKATILEAAATYVQILTALLGKEPEQRKSHTVVASGKNVSDTDQLADSGLAELSPPPLPDKLAPLNLEASRARRRLVDRMAKERQGHAWRERKRHGIDSDPNSENHDPFATLGDNYDDADQDPFSQDDLKHDATATTHKSYASQHYTPPHTGYQPASLPPRGQRSDQPKVWTDFFRRQYTTETYCLAPKANKQSQFRVDSSSDIKANAAQNSDAIDELLLKYTLLDRAVIAAYGPSGEFYDQRKSVSG